MELMLELSRLSRQEVLVVKACATTKDFEGVAKVLVDQYSGIHLREGFKSWNGRTLTPQSHGKSGKGYGGSNGSQSGKGSYKTPIPMRKATVDTSSTAQGGGGSFKNRKPIGEVGCCESGMAERSH